jgi:hypothetical protein
MLLKLSVVWKTIINEGASYVWHEHNPPIHIRERHLRTTRVYDWLDRSFTKCPISLSRRSSHWVRIQVLQYMNISLYSLFSMCFLSSVTLTFTLLSFHINCDIPSLVNSNFISARRQRITSWLACWICSFREFYFERVLQLLFDRATKITCRCGT